MHDHVDTHVTNAGKFPGGAITIIEYDDGHKCVDIGIPNARLYIEVDGPDHLNSQKKIEKDLEREHYSEIEGFHTIHVSNLSIDKDLNRIAEAISKVAQKRKEKIDLILI